MTSQTYSERLVRAEADYTALQIFALFCTFLLISVIPILTHTVPPLEDYANHLARMHVIADNGRDPVLSRFYEIDWEIIPDLVMDLIVPLLTRFFNVYLAGQIFLVAIYAVITTGIFGLNRALFGRWSVLPLVAFPLLYNFVFVVGVVNYLFGVGLALWALATWIFLRDRAWPLRYGASLLFAFALFVCHLYAVGIYGLGILAYELYQLHARRDEKMWRRILIFMSAGLPFLFLIPFLTGSSTWSHVHEFEWDRDGKIDGLIYVIEIYSDVTALALVAIFALGLVWAVRQKALRVSRFFYVLLPVATVVYIAMPRVVFATFMADQRMPIAVAFMLIACLQIELREESARRLFVLLSLCLLAGRVIEVDAIWARQTPLTLEMRDSMHKIARGSRILVAYAEESGSDDGSTLGLVHAACLAIIERSALVTTAFTVRGKQIMHTRPAFRGITDTEDGTPPTRDQLVIDALGRAVDNEAYWADWKDHFDYVYILFTDADADNPLPELLKPVYEGERFQLYKIIKPAAAPATPVKP